MVRSDTPFLLIDTSDGGARLYRAPERVLVAFTAEAVPEVNEEARSCLRSGRHIAGFLSYEAGAALAARPVSATETATTPLAWFGVFDGVEIVADVGDRLLRAAGAWISRAEPTLDRADYDLAFEKVKALIAAGDIYQANLTFPATARVIGDPLALYAGLRARSRAGHGALVWTGDAWILSVSPELFFTLAGDRLTARPMKGTARRGETAAEDRRLATMLGDDEKQRAENLMIVDLIRNDLSRVARAGSVAVPSLFMVERYPSILQMTSEVTARLAGGRDALDVLTAAFPCGSVTGAPKQRAMEVIAEVETTSRGVYTGSIGWIAPDGDAAFNVAIRTLHLAGNAERATLGLGSGVVADSRVEDEWDECLAKGAFLTHGQRRFDLIETMRFDPAHGIPLLDRHLARMKASAAMFRFAFDRHNARNELQAATFRLRWVSRVRLLLAPTGALSIQVMPAPEPRQAPLTIAVVPLPVEPSDFRLRHKSSDRAFYDEARRTARADEVIFESSDGRLTEGSTTTLFIRRDGRLLTPPLRDGLLPGVLRAELLDTGQAVEATLTRDDLDGEVLMGNALKGLMPARVVAAVHNP